MSAVTAPPDVDVDLASIEHLDLDVPCEMECHGDGAASAAAEWAVWYLDCDGTPDGPLLVCDACLQVWQHPLTVLVCPPPCRRRRSAPTTIQRTERLRP